MFQHKTISRMLVPIVTIAVLALMLPVGAASAATITVTPSPQSGVVGSALTLSTQSGTTAQTATIVFAAGTSFATTYYSTTNTTGGLTASIAVPPVPAGAYSVSVTIGSDSGSTTFQVVSDIKVNNADSLSPKVGDQVAILGRGFSAGHAISVSYDGNVVSTPTTDAYGSFGAVYITVPAAVYGSNHSIVAIDTTNAANNDVAVLTILQGVTVTPASGGVGETITIGGGGFPAYNQLTVYFGSVTLSTVPTTDANGSFTTTFVVPSGTNGTIQVVAITTNGAVSASATFTLVAAVRLTPASGVVGTQVTATGSAFGASRTVTVSLDGTQVATGSTDSVGAFSVAFALPAATGGAHTISASDNTYSASGTFTVSPQVSVNPKTGNVGTQITVNGSGFGASKSLAISFDNAQPGTATSDASGSFSGSFAAPASAAGNHNVSVTDGTNTATGQFTTTSSASLNPKSGPTGVQVSISGSGFKAVTALTIRFNNAQVKTATADGTGSFTDKFVVPDLDAGSYSVVATDGTNSVTLSFVVTASMRIDPTTGYVGSSLKVTGSGFTGTVTVKYDSATVATATADVNGAFTATFNVPVSLHGSHNITASDAATTLQRSFAMDSTPPPVPQPLTPVTAGTQNARPTFTWTGVTDPSGVSYTLQVATDSSFTNIVLQKQGLSEAQYKVQKTESLKATGKDAPYYWRVKATDQASNESAFSAANTFSVSVFPAWAMWLLIGIGAVIVVLIVFYIGMRIGRRSKA